MKKKSQRETRKVILSAAGLCILFVVLVMVNILFSFVSLRWDTTEEGLFSLSEGTKRILEKIEDPVEIHFYSSSSRKVTPPELRLFARKVRQFLQEYENWSKGKVKVMVYDPRPDSDQEEWAQKYGLKPIRVRGEAIYCGLAFTCLDQQDKISFLDPGREQLLEYDITRIIKRIQTPKRKVIGVLSSLNLFGSIGGGSGIGEEPWIFITELKKSYEVRQIPLSSKGLDSDLDLLVAIHPKNLNQQLQYAIDQFVLSGKSAIFLVDPFCVTDTQGGRFARPSSSSLPTLFRQWGISVDKTKVVADLDHPMALRGRDGRVERNPVWINATEELFLKESVVVAGLERMLFPAPGSVKKLPDSPYEFTPLIKTGENSALFDTFRAQFGPSSIRKDFKKAAGPIYLAALIQGKFKTAFPSGPLVKDKEGGEEDRKTLSTNHLKEAKTKASVLVVADADFLADPFYVQKRNIMGVIITRVFNDNLNFMANACEVLTGGQDLIEIRTRGRFERPFTKVLALQRKAQQKWLAKEQELVRQAEETNLKLRELEQQKDASQRLILSPEQEREIGLFRERKLKIQRELKQVRKNLRAEIEALGLKLKAINIFLMPFCVSIAGVAFAIYRHRRRRRA